jgi:hypothetical protein
VSFLSSHGVLRALSLLVSLRCCHCLLFLHLSSMRDRCGQRPDFCILLGCGVGVSSRHDRGWFAKVECSERWSQCNDRVARVEESDGESLAFSSALMVPTSTKCVDVLTSNARGKASRMVNRSISNAARDRWRRRAWWFCVGSSKLPEHKDCYADRYSRRFTWS